MIVVYLPPLYLYSGHSITERDTNARGSRSSLVPLTGAFIMIVSLSSSAHLLLPRECYIIGSDAYEICWGEQGG